MSEQMDELLYGLGSDDLNDFDFDDEPAERESDEEGDREPGREPIPDPFLPKSGGFSTGAGRALPPPSQAALLRGRSILERPDSPAARPAQIADDEDFYDRAFPLPDLSLIPGGFTTGGGRPVAPPSAQSLAKVSALFDTGLDSFATPQPQKRRKLAHDNDASDPHQTPAQLASPHLSDFDIAQRQALERFDDFPDELDDFAPALAGDPLAPPPVPLFRTAAGKIVQTPSAKAFEKARSMFDGEDLPTFVSAFSTGSGAPIAPPSKSALDAAAGILGDLYEPPATPSAFTTGSGSAVQPAKTARDSVAHIFDDLDRPIPPTSSFGFASGSPAPVKQSSRDQALAIFGETPQRPAPTSTAAHAQARPAASNAFVTPVRPGIRPTTLAFRPHTIPQRTPLQQHSNTFSIPNKARPIEIKSELKTPTLKRLGVGARPSPIKRSRTSFNTPFKDGGAKARKAMQGSQGTPVRAAVPREVVRDDVVYDMTVRSDRKTYRDAYLKPGYYNQEEMEEMGLPADLWNIDLTNACEYSFIDIDSGSPLGTAQACETLQADGCRLATPAWVDNHYAQILWRLAGVCRAQPNLFEARWNWAEVIDQLKYRYEREIGMAQRPVVRRIQEHDTSGGVPMILVVSNVRWVAVESEVQDGKGQTKGGAQAVGGKQGEMKPFLELTDGWYRINAEIDACLTRAVEKKRITIGQKLAICGAKLDSAGDGEEVLDALNKSRLVLSGNSTSLARWDARLGIHSPFTASLSSLSADGGIVSMIDVVVEKVFEIAWVNADRTVHEDPWNEAEEAIRRDRWREKYLSEMTRLNEEMQASLEPYQALADTLTSAAEGIAEDPGSSPDDIDDQFDRLLDAKNQSKVLGQFSDAMIVHLAAYARQRLNREITMGQDDVQSEISSSHPPRDVKPFRMIRVRDANEGNRPAFRQAMITVWDAKQVDIDQGARYRITSLYPTKSGDWSLPSGLEAGMKKEIYLGTRRETRWLCVGGGGGGGSA